MEKWLNNTIITSYNFKYLYLYLILKEFNHFTSGCSVGFFKKILVNQDPQTVESLSNNAWYKQRSHLHT